MTEEKQAIDKAEVAALVEAIVVVAARGWTVVEARREAIERQLFTPDALGVAFAHARRRRLSEDVKQLLAQLLAEALPQPAQTSHHPAPRSAIGAG